MINDNLIDEFRKIFGFVEPTEYEKEKWAYNCKLSISPIQFLIGKKIYCHKKYVGVVEKIEFKNKSLIMITEKGKYTLSFCDIEFFNNYYNKKVIIPLHPSRKGLKLWSMGHVFEENDFKSVYYKTDEYHQKMSKTLEKNFGVKGVISPFALEEVKKAANKTMKDRYGVESFLTRGDHYKKIENIMIDKYGFINLFNSHDWQIKNAENYKVNGKMESKVEQEIILELTKEIKFKSPIYSNETNKQFIVKINKSGKCYYSVDFYDKFSNIVIEIYGDFWHCNPNKFKKDYFHKYKKITAEQIWENDKIRMNNIINKLGCDFIVIWEGDWKKNKNNIINYIKELIKNKDANI